MIERIEITGHASQVLDELKIKLSVYQRGHQIKIGITSNPDTMEKHAKSKKHEWKKMVVVYKTTSHKSVSLLESELINYAIDKYPEKTVNEVSGGGGINIPESHANFYVYFLLKSLKVN